MSVSMEGECTREMRELDDAMIRLKDDVKGSRR